MTQTQHRDAQIHTAILRSGITADGDAHAGWDPCVRHVDDKIRALRSGPKTALTAQRKVHWQRELQKHRVHGALSTHPCDEVLLRQRKNFRAPPQAQKAKAQTVPVLSERMRRNPATPGCPDTKGTSAGMGPEDGCIFCDHRSGWGAAVDRAKQDEENAKAEAKLRYTARQSQNERKRQRKAREGNSTAKREGSPRNQMGSTDGGGGKGDGQPGTQEGRSTREDGTANERNSQTTTAQQTVTIAPSTPQTDTVTGDSDEGERADWEAVEAVATAAERRQYPRDTFAHMLRCHHSRTTVQHAMAEIVKGVNERINTAAKRTAKEDKDWGKEHEAADYHWTTQDVHWLDTTKTTEDRMTEWATPYTGTPAVRVWPTGRNGEHRPDDILRQSNKVATWASFPPKGLRAKLGESLLTPDEVQATWNRTIQPAIANALHKMVHDRIDIEEAWAMDRARHPEHICQSYRKREWPDETPALQKAWNRACRDLEATIVMAAAQRHMDRNCGVRDDLNETIEIDNIQKRSLRDDMRMLLANPDRWDHLEAKRLATRDDRQRHSTDGGDDGDDDEDSGMW